MKKLILLISACALCVPCFGQDAPVYPCSPAEEVVAPCAPVAEQIAEVEAVDCAGCEGQTVAESTVIVKQKIRRIGFRRNVGKHECKLLQRIKTIRAAKRVRQGSDTPCVPASVVQPCEPVGYAG